MLYSIAEAKDNLPKLVREAEHGGYVELTRRGEPVAVILSIHDYRKLSVGSMGFWNACLALRKAYDVVSMDIQPEVFDVRDPSPGRDFEW